MMLQLTIALGRYDRTEALRDGRVQPEGLDLTVLTLGVEEIFWRMLHHREFDAAELSLAGYVIRRSRGEDDLIAIPVFPSRAFRHSAIFVHADSGLRGPADLRGRVVGVPEYQMTAAVWVRAMLSEEYGIEPGALRWVQGGLEQPGRVPHTTVNPSGVEISLAPRGLSLTEMLRDGHIDALITARTPSLFTEEHGEFRRLLAEPWNAERDYFVRTGVFPIMHLIALRAELLQSRPWIAQTLFKAFVSARDRAIAGLSETSALAVSLPFLSEHAHATRELMGTDYWPYGLPENRTTLELFIKHLVSQDLIPEPVNLESLFAPTTIGTAFRI